MVDGEYMLVAFASRWNIGDLPYCCCGTVYYYPAPHGGRKVEGDYGFARRPRKARVLVAVRVVGGGRGIKINEIAVPVVQDCARICSTIRTGVMMYQVMNIEITEAGRVVSIFLVGFERPV